MMNATSEKNFTPLCTTFDIVHDMTCLDLFCKGQFVLNFSRGMPLSDSLSTFFDSNCYCMTVLHVLSITYQIDEHASTGYLIAKRTVLHVLSITYQIDEHASAGYLISKRAK